MEVKIDFKKKVEFDPANKESSDVTAPDVATATAAAAAAGTSDETPIATETVKTEQELAEEEERAAIATVLLASAAVKKKRRKHKFAIVSLPLVPCVQFRGLSGKYKQNIAMQQSFATLYKMISQSFANRDVAFKMGVADEISVIATVCQGMPRVLDYYIWIVDALYKDGFGEINTDELDVRLTNCFLSDFFCFKMIISLPSCFCRLHLKIIQWCCLRTNPPLLTRSPTSTTRERTNPP